MSTENTKEKAPKVVPITRDDMIADVVRQYPELAEVFMDFGVHCVGCYVSEFETIEQGILGHGFLEEDLDELIRQMNEIIADPEFQAERTDDEFADMPEG